MLRRGFLGLLPGAFLVGSTSRCLALASLEVERIVHDHPLPSTSTRSRSYRADAAVMFLGVTLFRRQNVGGGLVRFEEAEFNQKRRTGITFQAGSDPNRTRGLNRLGYIQEISLEEDSVLREAAYFGFMTSSPEESFTDARNALEKQGKGGLPYTTIDGVNNAGQSRSASHHWIFPAEYDWSRCDSLVTTAREKTRSTSGDWRRTDWNASTTPGTFLNTVLQAMRMAPARSQATYIFGAKRYKLKTEKGQESNGLTKLKGEILDEATNKTSSFSVWFEADNPLPRRFEFQPKAYLRLIFDAV